MHSVIVHQIEFYEDDGPAKGLLKSEQRIQTIKPIHAENLDGTMDAAGPGTLRVLQRGSTPSVDGERTPGTVKPKDLGLKLTWVRFTERMKANQIAKTAVFNGQTEAVYIPATDIDAKVDKSHLPEDGFSIECLKRLEMSTTKGVVKGVEKTYQNLNAEGDVIVRGQYFVGASEKVKYEEEKETIIFEGTRDNPGGVEAHTRQGRPARGRAGAKRSASTRARRMSTSSAGSEFRRSNRSNREPVSTHPTAGSAAPHRAARLPNGRSRGVARSRRA